MSKKILLYKLQGQAFQDVPMPKSAEILDVKIAPGVGIQLYALVNVGDTTSLKYKIGMFGDHETIEGYAPNKFRHISTILTQALQFHVFLMDILDDNSTQIPARG